MNVYVVRLNPDLRASRNTGEKLPYSSYPSLAEYKKMHNHGSMNGFHEAVNFLPENGFVKGYLPPKHLKEMRGNAPFVLITITVKTVNGEPTGMEDKIIGIQTGCFYTGEQIRFNPKDGKVTLTSHYACAINNSLLLPELIENARNIIVSKEKPWVRGPVYRLPYDRIAGVFKKVFDSLPRGALRKQIRRIYETTIQTDAQLHGNLSTFDFEKRVQNELQKDLVNVVGNQHPDTRRVYSDQYIRDPAVVAYALKVSHGICHDCKQTPFISKLTGKPFLEVHHINMLKDGGSDTPDNVIALCPNCHRKRHFG